MRFDAICIELTTLNNACKSINIKIGLLSNHEYSDDIFAANHFDGDFKSLDFRRIETIECQCKFIGQFDCK